MDEIVREPTSRLADTLASTTHTSMFPKIVPPTLDVTAQAAARQRQQNLTKPRGSLGPLEELPVWLAGIQGVEHPASRPAAALLFAADHPVTRHGVSAYPAAVTAAMLRNFASGGAAASVLCGSLGVPLRVIDVGVSAPLPDVAGVVDSARDPVAELPAGDLRSAEAMPTETFGRAIAAGASAVDRLASDVRVVVLGEMGIGNTTAAAAVAAALLDEQAEALVGPGTGVSGAAFEKKLAVVRDALAALRRSGALDPAEILQRVGGRELAALAGAAARACERGMAVLVDGFVVSVALFALVRARPQVRPFLWFAHRSQEPGHDSVLRAMDAKPLLDLGLRLGEGSGALAALPILDLACDLHRGMATFDEAAVPDAEGGQ